jgi:ACR3 family arsenite transporter
VPLYVLAIAVGVYVGWMVPDAASGLAVVITPALAVMLFATFLGVPFNEIARSFRDMHFLATVCIVNFVAVPVVVWALSRFVADERGLLVGVLLVLLTPCVDYVVVFVGLAGGARARLLAATPLLMLLQIVLLPLYLLVLAGPGIAALIDPAPFVTAFVVLIALPLAAAGTVQVIARSSGFARGGGVKTGTAVARGIRTGMAGAMVPLMMATLFAVFASQTAAVGAEVLALLRLVPLYAVFLAVMLGVGLVAARIARVDIAGTRALVFSGATRNSLVVLPLALALPDTLALAPLAVVTQTLVELVGMVVFVRLVPRLTPPRPRAGA